MLGDKDDTNWLDDLGKSEERKEPEKVSEAEEAIVPLDEEVVVEDNRSVHEKIIGQIKMKLSDKNFVSSEHLNFPTCNRILEIVELLEKTDGNWLEGRKTLDGFTIDCPIYGYAPMHRCYFECEHWKGDGMAGVCTRDIDDVDHKIKKIDQDEARNIEIDYRMKEGAKAKEE